MNEFPPKILYIDFRWIEDGRRRKAFPSMPRDRNDRAYVELTPEIRERLKDIEVVEKAYDHTSM